MLRSFSGTSALVKLAGAKSVDRPAGVLQIAEILLRGFYEAQDRSVNAQSHRKVLGVVAGAREVDDAHARHDDVRV